ncbi:MAG TPA: winged helix-turn-helix domain-containing protein [Blastocatellia bacterium]|jgi:Tol biopolymer transport system component/DNA-binding winged helix-turn-helix (wHTH) protein|nr:winged helix-turn-helix domain-containing protein [Blastocatellia bacterium]
MMEAYKHFYDFGPFRLDPADRLLLRDGHHVPLTPKAFETLLILVENSGRVIDKDELIKKVWPDTFVEEVNLAKNVSYLRKILGGEEAAKYIETIPKRGYRFVANVKDVSNETATLALTPAAEPGVIDREEKENDVSEFGSEPRRESIKPEILPLQAKPQSNHWGRWGHWPGPGLAIGVIIWAMLAIVIAIWAMFIRPARQSPAPLFNIVPFTSYPSRETQAAFSPDGNQIAFVWDGGKGDNSDIYVKLIGAGQPLRLTTNPAADTHPVWTPDGRYIAFLRQSAEGSGFYLIPALGGIERKVADVFPYRDPFQGNSQYVAPDGKFLAVVDKNSQEEPFSIYLVSIETGEKQKVTAPAAGAAGDSYPAFSPDGKTLAFLRSSSQATTDLYLRGVDDGGEPRRLTFDNTSILGFAWSSDNREIVFSSRRGGSIYSLWRIPVNGGTPERLPTIGQNVISPAISRQGGRLVYTESLDDQNIWRLELDAAGRAGEAANLISSTLGDKGPDYSPDGRKVVFASNRSGGFGIWVCDSDGANPVQLIDRGPYLTGTPRWSPDGRWIAFDSRSNDAGREGNADIYLISAEGGQPRRLTTDPAEDVAPSWSRDGKWIYCGSTRGGNMQIWKIPVEGGQATQVTKQGGFEGFESLDGKLLYYAKGRLVPGIWQTPVNGGPETSLLDNNKAGYWRFWAVAPKGIYFATANEPAHPIIEFFSFSTHKVAIVVTLDKPLSPTDPGLTVAPNGRSLLFAQLDQSGSDLMLVENFR